MSVRSTAIGGLTQKARLRDVMLAAALFSAVVAVYAATETHWLTSFVLAAFAVSCINLWRVSRGNRWPLS